MTRPRHLRAIASLRSALVLAIILGAVSLPALAEKALTPPETPSGKVTKPVDPLSSIGGSGSSWFVSQTEAGCYAISPFGKTSSRVAIGRHPTLGIGVFVIDLALAVSRTNDNEAVVLMVDGERRAKAGKVVANRLLFIPLSPAEIDAELRELQDTSVIWVEVRHAWIGHGGRTTREAVAAYGQACRDPSNKPS